VPSGEQEREREGHFVKTDNNNYYNFKVVNFNLIFLDHRTLPAARIFMI